MSRVLVMAAILAGSAGLARADSHVCASVEPDLFSIDGMYDEWPGINRGTRAGGHSRDAAFVLRCAFDANNLYLLVNVRDDKLIRTRKPKKNTEDNLAITLRTSKDSRPIRIRAFPGTPTGGPKRIGVPKWMEVEDSLQDKGFSFEAAIPLAKLDGWSSSVPALLAEIVYNDADKATEYKIQDTIRFSGTLERAGAVLAMRQFLKAAKLSRSDITLDVMADVDTGAGPERVIAGGTIVGVLSDAYVFMSLPVDSGSDVKAVKVVNFSGDGRSQILVHARQRGNGGSRDVVIIFNVDAGAFTKVLGFEVRKQLGDNVIENKWSLVKAGTRRKLPRGKKKARGLDILIEATKAVGWDEDNFEEVRATDVKPILLPWEDQTTAVWFFDGDIALGGEPATK